MSQTSAAGPTCDTSCTSLRMGIPVCFLYSRENAQAFFQLRTAKGGDRRAIGFVVRRFENVRDAQFCGDGAQAFGHARRVSFAFDHARSGDQEKGRVGAEANLADRKAARWWHVVAIVRGNRLCGNEQHFNFELRGGEKITAETPRTQRKAKHLTRRARGKGGERRERPRCES